MGDRYRCVAVVRGQTSGNRNGSITAQSPSRTNSNETAFPAQAEEPRKQSLTAAPTPNPTTINLPYPLPPPTALH